MWDLIKSARVGNPQGHNVRCGIDLWGARLGNDSVCVVGLQWWVTRP